MLSFELSAIDIILVISVVVLFILYLNKTSVGKHEKITLKKPTFRRPSLNLNTKKTKYTNEINTEISEPVSQRDFTECPRGFGNIKKLNSDNSVSERCLGCYKIMDCYGERDKA
jgi:hypothetical protein